MLGSLVAVACGGEPRRPEMSRVESVQQPLGHFVAPVNGGALLVAGTGERGNLSSSDPKAGTLDGPAGVLALVGPTGPYVLVADWGNNAIKSISQAGLQRIDAMYRNLLVNPRAEIVDGGAGIPGWKSPSGWGSWSAVSSPCPTCGDPVDGNRMFYAGNSATGARLYQDVDVSDSAQAIDFGQVTYCFTGLLRSHDETNPDSNSVLIRSYRANSLTPIDDGRAYTGEQKFTKSRS